MMLNRPTMDATLNAYRVARARAAAAAEIEAELLHALVYDAEEAGMSVRETAAILQVPKSTVARHRRGHAAPAMHKASTWITPDAYVEAHNAAWVSSSQHIDSAPFTMTELPDGSRQFEAVPVTERGVMHFQAWREQ